MKNLKRGKTCQNIWGGNLPIHAHYGFHHYAMWGGTSPEYGDLPDSWDTCKKIFLARIQLNVPLK